jgi:hypothetical protein
MKLIAIASQHKAPAWVHIPGKGDQANGTDSTGRMRDERAHEDI